MKIKIGDIEYEFKHINLPTDHGFDEEHLKFLMKIDEALVKAREGITKQEDIEKIKTDFDAKIKTLKDDFGNLSFEKLQKQINDIYIEIAKAGLKPAATKEELARQERVMNSNWLRALAKKDSEKVKKIGLEIKQRFQTPMDPIMHLGPATDEIDEDYTQGGYLVPILLTTEIYRFVTEGGIARREFGSLPFGGPGNTRELHRLLTSVTISWIDEGEEKPKTKPTTTKVTQTLKEMAAMVLFTENLLEDAAIDWVSYCSPLLGEEIAAEEDNQFFVGTGAPWTGLINDPAITSVALAPTVGPLDMRPEVLLALPNVIPSTALPGSKYYMHRSVWSAICARRSDAVAANDVKGNYLIQQPSQGSPGSIWGYPVVLVEAMPSLTDLGYGEGDDECDPDLPFIIFGNLKKCVIYGDKGGIKMKVLDQASVYDNEGNLINLAERNMIALRCSRRVGYVTILPAGIVILATGAVS